MAALAHPATAPWPADSSSSHSTTAREHRSTAAVPRRNSPQWSRHWPSHSCILPISDRTQLPLPFSVRAVLCQFDAMPPLGLVAAASSALLAGVVHASTLQPPVLPLIVRNPYLSTWLGNARDEPWHKWPIFWTGGEVPSPSGPSGISDANTTSSCRLDSAS